MRNERAVADHLRTTAEPDTVAIPREAYAFLMGEGPLEGVWFGDLHEGLPGAFWWRGVLRCAAGWPQAPTPDQSGEAGETAKHGSTEGESGLPAESGSS